MPNKKKPTATATPLPHPAPKKTIAPTRWALENPGRNGVQGPLKRGVKLTPVTHLQYKTIEEGYNLHFLA